jgi:hypothetical protein
VSEPYPATFKQLAISPYSYRSGPVNVCQVCFSGPGYTELLRWGRSKRATPTFHKLVILIEAAKLADRLDRTRRGFIKRRVYARRQAATLLATAARFQSRYIDPLGPSERAELAANLACFTDGHARLGALVDPGANPTIIANRLAAELSGGRQRRLDDTPTLLAIDSSYPRMVNWYEYCDELLASLRISPPSCKGTVAYGPRFAIDYLLRSLIVNSNTYVVATPVPDHAIAVMAAGLWDPTARNSLGDILDVVDTAHTLADHSPPSGR